MGQSHSVVEGYVIRLNLRRVIFLFELVVLRQVGTAARIAVIANIKIFGTFTDWSPFFLH